MTKGLTEDERFRLRVAAAARSRPEYLERLVERIIADRLRSAADDWDAAGTCKPSILGGWLRERAAEVAP